MREDFTEERNGRGDDGERKDREERIGGGGREERN